MSLRISAALAAALLMIAASIDAPLHAQSLHQTVMNGRCQYSDEVARHRDETTLVLCDTVTIGSDDSTVSLDFGRRSWGSAARFTGDVTGSRMQVSQIAVRNDRAVPATGVCEIFRRNDGKVSYISCLAKAGSRSIAANFVPSHV